MIDILEVNLLSARGTIARHRLESDDQPPLLCDTLTFVSPDASSSCATASSRWSSPPARTSDRSSGDLSAAWTRVWSACSTLCQSRVPSSRSLASAPWASIFARLVPRLTVCSEARRSRSSSQRASVFLSEESSFRFNVCSIYSSWEAYRISTYNGITFQVFPFNHFRT